MQRYRHYRQFLSRAAALVARCRRRLRKIIAFLGYAAERIPATAFRNTRACSRTRPAFLDKFARDDLRIRCEEAYAFVADPDDRAVLGGDARRLHQFPLAAAASARSHEHGGLGRVPHAISRSSAGAAGVNLPLDYRLRGGTDKWVLKEVAARYLPREVVYRRKVGFPLPVKDYLAPLAQPDLFVDGFCVNALGHAPARVSSTPSRPGIATSTGSSTCSRWKSGDGCSCCASRSPRSKTGSPACRARRPEDADGGAGITADGWRGRCRRIRRRTAWRAAPASRNPPRPDRTSPWCRMPTRSCRSDSSSSSRSD